jgi:hypothetical protein
VKPLGTLRRSALLAVAAVAVAAGAQPSPPKHPAQRIPAAAEFPTGPAIGERLPDFRLPNQLGETIDFHGDRAGRKAAVMFQRSAVW